MNDIPLTTIVKNLHGWVFYTPDGEMLEANIERRTCPKGHYLHLQLFTTNEEQVSVPIDQGLRAPYLDATKRALEALKKLRAPAPSRISRPSTRGRSRIRGGGS